MVRDDMRPFVSVIMPVRNERKNIKYCIDGFLSQTYPRSRFELVVADKSDDGTREVLEEYEYQFPGWLFLYDNPTGKIAEGYNIALSHARGSILNCYIGHAFPSPDYLEQLVDSLARNDIDLVGGRVIPVPASPNLAAQGIAIALKNRFTIGLNAFTREKACPVTSNHWMAVRREIVDCVGEFNTRFPRGEDCDWYERMMAAGAKTLYDPRIRSFYFPRNTLARQFSIQVTNAWYRMRLFCATGRGMRFRHIFPILLLIVWCAVCVLLTNPLGSTVGSAMLYGLALTAVSWGASRGNVRLFPYVLAATFLIHLGHILGMFAGLIVFGMKRLIPISNS